MEQTRRVSIPMQVRLAPIGTIDQETRTAELVWTTGERVHRFDFWAGEEYLEELAVEASAVRMERLQNGAPLLDTHNRWDLKGVIGVVEKASLANGAGRATVRFSKRDEVEPVFRDVKDKIIRNVSVGYKVHKYDRTKTDSETGLRIYRAVDWEPTEISLVGVGADSGAGVRSDEQRTYPCEIINPAVSATTQESTMTTETRAAATQTADTTAAAAAAATAAQPAKSPSAVEQEQSRIKAITNLARINNIGEATRDAWIGQGYSFEQVADDLVRVLEERGKANPQPASKLGLTLKETSRFSLQRAIRACAEKDWSLAGFELECSRSIAQKLNQVANPNKFYVPFEVMERPVEQKRDLTVATAGAGGFLVQTDNVGFIEMLRNRSVAFRMGARRLSGLQGNVTIPRQSAAATAVWLANEASTLTESQQTFVQLALTPKNVGAYTEISRQLLLQSSPGAEGIVTDDLAQVTAVAVDLAVLEGSGASGQPTGISNTAGIGGVTGTSIAYAGILEFQTDVASSNVMPARGGYVTTPAVAALLMQRVKFTSTASPLWEGNVWDGMMAGFTAMSSNQPTAATMIFGDWQEVVVGEWGVLEVEVNPYANFQAGIIGVRAIYSMDVGVRRPFAFSRATSIT